MASSKYQKKSKITATLEFYTQQKYLSQMKVEMKMFSDIWRPTKKAEGQCLIAFFGFSRHVYYLGKVFWFIYWVPTKTVSFEWNPGRKQLQNNAGPGFGANSPAT